MIVAITLLVAVLIVPHQNKFNLRWPMQRTLTSLDDRPGACDEVAHLVVCVSQLFWRLRKYPDGRHVPSPVETYNRR
jgi:hypothetical protein